MKKITALLMTLILIFTLTACSTSAGAINAVTAANVTQSSAAASEVLSSASEAAAVSGAAVAVTQSPSAAGSVADALAENSNVHDDAEDYAWDSAEVVSIVLNGSSISIDGDGVVVDDSQATITAAGTYSLSGSLADG